MAITIADIQTLSNQYLRDTSTNSVSAADRLRAIGESIKQLYNEFGFDFSNETYNFDFLDTVNYYKLTSNVPDFLEPVDLRHRNEEDHRTIFSRKSSREFFSEITQAEDDTFATEVRDRTPYLGVIHSSKYSPTTLHNCDSVTANGTWAVDATNSDAITLTADDVEFEEGQASL